MNTFLTSLSLTRCYSPASLFNGRIESLFIAKSTFTKSFCRIFAGNSNELSVSRCDFSRLLSSCFYIVSNCKDINQFLSVSPLVAIEDSSFHDFQYGSFSYIVKINDQNTNLYFARCIIYNMVVVSTSQNTLVCFYLGNTSKIINTCASSCNLGYPSFGVYTIVTNCISGHQNYTSEYNNTHVGGSWVAGRDFCASNYNNVTFTKSTSDTRAGLSISYCKDSYIGGYSIITRNIGSSFALFDLLGSTVSMTSLHFINNSNSISAIDVNRDGSKVILMNCAFYSNKLINPIARFYFSTNYLTLTNSSFETLPSSQTRVTTSSLTVSEQPLFNIQLDDSICICKPSNCRQTSPPLTYLSFKITTLSLLLINCYR